MPYFNIVVTTNENTVVTEYEPVRNRSDSYQSEAELEQEFIRLLTEQGYEYLPIHSEKELVANLRRRLEALNGIRFSDVTASGAGFSLRSWLIPTSMSGKRRARYRRTTFRSSGATTEAPKISR